MNETKITGLIAAPYTPFNSHGALNLDLIQSYAEYLKVQGVSGVFVGGTTGEGMLMTLEERKSLLEEWMKYQSPEFKILCHAGATSYIDSQNLVSHAQELKVDAVSVMGPLFLRPDSVEDLVEYCRKVALAADETPFYYYHIPSVSGVSLSMHEFLSRAANKIPTLAGIKFTDSNLMEMNLCIHADQGQWNILHGQDETLLAGLSLGITGGVGSTYNYLAPLYLDIIKDYTEGNIDAAQTQQLKAVQFIKELIHFGGGVIGGKPLMKLVGLDCGPLRSPARNLSRSQLDDFEKRIQNLDILQYMLSNV